MASEIARDRVYGNFKPSRGERAKTKSAKTSAADRRPGMSRDHLTLIRKLPCVACLKVPAGEAHHLKCTCQRGMGLRSEDRHAIPLCRHDHDTIERAGAKNEISTLRSWGVDDPLQLAADLWRSTGDQPHMTRILLAHKWIGRPR